MSNFDELTNRKNTYSIKWNINDNELPMWIADQDFYTFKPIYDGIIEEANVKAYGYVDLKDDYFKAYQHWFLSRYNYKMDTSRMIFSEGVVGSISAICNYFLKDGDCGTILTPVYNIFRNSIINNHGTLLLSSLIEDNLEYSINWDDFEEKISKSKIFIMCNPHNPIGKIWSKEEMIKIGEICHKYGCLVISDEIHCDFMQNGARFIPFASTSEINRMNTISLYSPSKTFNVASLKSSIAYVENEELYKKVYRAIINVELGEPSYFAIKPVINAYNLGSEYVDELNQYIYENKQIAHKFIKEHLPHVKYEIKDALYLIWLDLSYYKRADLVEFIKNNTGLILASGHIYGEEAKYFLRMNLATSHDFLLDGLKRLETSLEILEK